MRAQVHFSVVRLAEERLFSVPWGGLYRLMPHSFPMAEEYCINCGADPLVRAGPPGPAPRLREQGVLTSVTGRRGRRPADLGGHPTIYAGVQQGEDYAALRLDSPPHIAASRK